MAHPPPLPLRGLLHLQVKRVFCFTSGPGASRCARYIKTEPVLSVQSRGALRQMLSCYHPRAAKLFCLTWLLVWVCEAAWWLNGSPSSVLTGSCPNTVPTQIFHASQDLPTLCEAAHFCSELHVAKRISILTINALVHYQERGIIH